MKDRLGQFTLGASVIKMSGDYKFKGEIVSIFAKRSGNMRLVVENDDGLLFIFNATQLKLVL